MNTPINKGTIYNQVRDNLNSGVFQVVQSSGKPYIKVNGQKKLSVLLTEESRYKRLLLIISLLHRPLTATIEPMRT